MKENNEITDGKAIVKLPWNIKLGKPMVCKIGKHLDGYMIGLYNDDFENENGYYIGEVRCTPDVLEERKLIAAELVRRYNSFPVLLEALKKAKDFIVCLMENDPDGATDFLINNGEKAEELIDAAIQSAEKA